MLEVFGDVLSPIFLYASSPLFKDSVMLQPPKNLPGILDAGNAWHYPEVLCLKKKIPQIPNHHTITYMFLKEKHRDAKSAIGTAANFTSVTMCKMKVICEQGIK